MKTLISLAAAAALFGAAGGAMAQDSHAVDMTGTAEASCTLPTDWSFVSGGGGANGGQFSGTTWTIPGSALADASSLAVSGSNYSLRVRGIGSCNSSHQISIQSLRGGLVAGDDPDASPPAGFANRRTVNYEAYWSDGGAGAATIPYGPAATLSADTAGEQTQVSYVVSGALFPPGNRAFDVAMRVLRPAIPTPLIAGHYEDSIVVTIGLLP